VFFLYDHNILDVMLKMRQDYQSSNAFVRLAFSASETAQILGVSRATVYRMVALEEIRPICHNGTFRFSQKEIDRYLANTMAVAV
jgi:excisionase family DNA binding protein